MSQALDSFEGSLSPSTAANLTAFNMSERFAFVNGGFGGAILPEAAAATNDAMTVDVDGEDQASAVASEAPGGRKARDDLTSASPAINQPITMDLPRHPFWHPHVYSPSPKAPTPHTIADILGWNCNRCDEPLNLTTKPPETGHKFSHISNKGEYS